jgi:hypothetical protein
MVRGKRFSCKGSGVVAPRATSLAATSKCYVCGARPGVEKSRDQKREDGTPYFIIKEHFETIINGQIRPVT